MCFGGSASTSKPKDPAPKQPSKAGIQPGSADAQNFQENKSEASVTLEDREPVRGATVLGY